MLVAAAYLFVHLPFLAPSLEDIDSINFGLGLREFNVAKHQPHPPGYPLYIALGRLSLAAVTSLWPSLDLGSAEALALAIWSAFAGAVAIVAAAWFFQTLADCSGHRVVATPFWATLLLATAPLFWVSGLRPMSDMPGLAAALVAQALMLRGDVHRRRLVEGALVAGLAAGIRSQTVWLTLPLMMMVLARQRHSGFWWLVSRPVAAFLAGIMVWAIPLVLSAGGVTGYTAALATQAGEDFAWVDMLWANPTPRRLAFALYETFVLPWALLPLAIAIAIAMVLGALMMLARERRALMTLAIAFAPYLALHLLFQETPFIRYALPVLPGMAWLAARGLASAGPRTAFAAAPLVAVALIVAVPAAAAYRSEPHPAFRAIADMAKLAATRPPAAVYSHFGLWRPLQTIDPERLRLIEPRRQYEWMGLVEYWRRGGTAPVWFLADPRRTDVALIDPSSRADVTRYRWSVAGRPEFGGARPLGADWYRFEPPGWFAGEGWSLTPETGGLARATATGPDHRPIEAWVRRRPGSLHLLVGGRHLGEPGDPAAQFELAIDGRIIDRWMLTVEERNFLRFVDGLDANGAVDGVYAHLTIASHAIGAGALRAAVAIRQFDAQSADRIIYGFGEGWHEAESTPATGASWRWTSERSVLRVKPVDRPVRLTLRGESPLRYFDGPPTVRITAAGHSIAEFRPATDFEWSVTVPADALAASDGAVAIETDRIYLPGKAEGTGDQRHLGLRLFECRADPVSH
jgi:hypothetical protein